MTESQQPDINDIPVTETPPAPAAPRADAILTAAKVLSYIFSPLLMPAYGMAIIMWFSVMTFLVPTNIKVILTAITLCVTCMLPVVGIFLLWKKKVIHDPALNDARDRTIPFIVSAACYVGMGIYLNCLHAADWICSFMYGGAAAILIDMLVNMRWKISGHATAQGGLLALIFFLLYHGLAIEGDQLWFGVAVVVAGLVCTSRLILGRHTLGQLAAGFVCGFICVLAAATYL